jgi:malate synthase
LSWAVYLVISVGFSSLIIFSVYKSVLHMTPEAPANAGSVLSEDECLQGARTLFTELEQRRKALADEADVTHADQRFLDFRVEWLQRKRNVEARCGLESRERLRETFASLDHVLDLYTTASVQFSGGVGPATDELKKQLAH